MMLRTRGGEVTMEYNSVTNRALTTARFPYPAVYGSRDTKGDANHGSGNQQGEEQLDSEFLPLVQVAKRVETRFALACPQPSGA